MMRGFGRRCLLLGATAALASISVVAVAQPAAGPSPGGWGGPGPGMMGGGGMMGGYWNTPNYLDALKTQRGITANEEPEWKEYADTVLGVGEQMRGLHQNMFAANGHRVVAASNCRSARVLQPGSRSTVIVHMPPLRG